MVRVLTLRVFMAPIGLPLSIRMPRTDLCIYTFNPKELAGTAATEILANLFVPSQNNRAAKVHRAPVVRLNAYAGSIRPLILGQSPQQRQQAVDFYRAVDGTHYSEQ